MQVARTCCRANTGPRAPRCLPMGDGRSRAISQSTRDTFHQLFPHRRRQRREVQDVHECNAIVRYAPRPSFFIPSTVSLALLPSHACTLRKFQCVYVCCSVRADAVTPLRGPSPRAHIHAPEIRARARPCGYIRPPPRESSATRVFYSNFRSAYLNSAPFFLLLFV